MSDRGDSRSTYAEYRPDITGQPVESLIIRSANIADVEEIAAVDIAVNRRNDTVSEIAPLISAEFEKIAQGELNRAVFVGSVDGKIVGFAKLGWMEFPDHPHIPTGWAMTGVNVLPEWRRRSIGRKLTAFRIQWLREKGIDKVTYWTGNLNRASRALHREFSFVEIARDVPIPFGQKNGWVFSLEL